MRVCTPLQTWSWRLSEKQWRSSPWGTGVSVSLGLTGPLGLLRRSICADAKTIVCFNQFARSGTQHNIPEPPRMI